MRPLRSRLCRAPCGREPDHPGSCACEAHAGEPLGTTRRHEDDGGEDTFAALLQWTAPFGGPDAAMQLRRQGFATLKMLREASLEDIAAAGASAELVASLADAPSDVRLESSKRGTKRPSTGDNPEPTAVVPFRKDQPVVRPTSGGSLKKALASAATPAAREEALAELRADMYAPSSQGPRDSTWTTWCALAEAWRVPPVPVTSDTVLKVVASLKKGGYRAAQQYVSRARIEHVRAMRRSPSPAAKLAIRDSLRSARRGIGPAALKDAVAFETLAPTLHFLEPGQAPGKVVGAPLDPCAMVVLGTWWFTRGIEIAAARACHVRVMPKSKTIGWSLPVSKRDISALGEERVHGCCCAPPRDSPLCPYHTMERYARVLAERFGEATKAGIALPLFPDVEGNPLSKQAVRDAISGVIAATGEPLTRAGPDGAHKDRFGEHVLRVMAAQFLARKKVDLYRIQLFARWGSNAVLRYVQDAPLSVQSEIASEVLLSPTIRDITTSVKELKDTAAGDEELARGVAARHATDVAHLRELVKDIAERLRNLEGKQTGDKPPYVRNSGTGVVHRVLVGAVDVPPALWATACPWKFGKALHAERCGPPGETDAICERCFPEIAASRRCEEGAGSGSESEA